MDPAVSIALIVACASLTGPLLLSWLNNRNLAKAKIEDYRRQDEVERRVLERDERQAEEAEAARQQADMVAVRLAESNAHITGKLDDIHGLVNSQLSAALENELAAVVDRVAVMREIINLNRKNNIDPTPETLEAIKLAEARIKELRGQLSERRT